MLQFILGRAGSGRTEQVLSALKADVSAHIDRPLLLLVPEQFSFESERMLLQRLGVQDAAKVQVLSFTRLADRVLRETGGIATRVMDEVTRALIMSRALEIHAAPENREEDVPIKARTYDTAYLSSLLALSAECKQCAISPRLLRASADGLEDGTLKTKLSDLSAVFDIYDGLTIGSGIDPEDLLRILAEKLPESQAFDGAHIYVDGFKGFTATELDILGLLMTKADVTVTLCTDSAEPSADHAAYGLFSPVERSLRQLRLAAADRGVAIGEPLLLRENHRASDPALKALEAGCFAPRGEVFDKDASAVTVTACPDIHSECAAAARAIRRTLRETGMRAKDIAVIVRDLQSYSGILDNALRRAQVPYYMDEAADVYTMPLISLCLSALQICVGGWQTEELLRMMKTGLLPFDEIETATLENYVFMWRIDGKRWEKPFTANPAGLTEKSNFDHDTLHMLETIRRRLTAPLRALREALAGRIEGAAFAKAVYGYLTDDAVLADAGVRRLYEALCEEGEPLLAERTARLWDNVMELLDHFAAVFSAEHLPVRRYAELFHLAAGLTRLPSVPQGLDAVQIGSADHVRLQSPKAVFILGANEGVFPAYPSDGVLLTDREREQLEQTGLFLSADRLQKAAEERFFAYTAIAAPSEKLYVSYLQNRGGETALPSVLVETIRKILPQHTKGVCRLADGSDVESVTEALDRLAAAYTAKDTPTATLRAALSATPGTDAAIAAMERGASKPVHTLHPENAAALFGQDMHLSASQADTFYRCRFRYFCQYGMRLQTRRVADVDASLFGTFSHYILEKLLPEYIRSGEHPSAASIPAMQQRIHAVLFNYVEEEMGGFADKPARFRYLLSLVERTCFSLLWFTVNEMAQSRFIPTDYELVIGKGGVPSPTLQLPEGRGSISIVGKIDRVDIYRRDDTVFVRVVDYKTGTKEFKLSEIPYGINMQMLLYLFAVCQNGQARYETSNTVPAGVLYLPAKDITLKNTHAPLDESRLKLMRMNGLLLRDADVLTAMEESGEGVFIPATVEGGEIGKNSSAILRSDFDNIRMLTEKLLIGMADALLAGDVQAIPTGEEQHLPCEYCDFRSVCGREAEDPATVMQSAKMDDILQMIGEEATDNG